MSRIARHNLQEFCRACLSSLSAERGKYDLKGTPQLKTLLIIFTSLDAFDDEYPQSVCQLCYSKLMEFKEFRLSILKSGRRIEAILKDESILPDYEYETGKQQVDNDSDDEDDDTLLLPELSINEWNPKIVKTELFENEESNMTGPSNGNEVKIKNEIFSEQDDSSSQFYENNALCDFYQNAIDSGNNFPNQIFFSASIKNCKTAGNTSSSKKRDRSKKSLKCPRCDKQVYKQVYLDAHIRGVHEGYEKPFLCSECQKSFTRYNQLHGHIQTSHTMNIKFVCDFAGCDATFRMSQTLETHRKVVHTEDVHGEEPIDYNHVIAIHQQQLSHEMEMDHYCPECGKKYSSKRALSEHLKRHAQIKEHICKVCGVAKVTRTELQTHLRTHESNLEKFKCTQCPQEFNHKNAIARHIRVVHEGERRFTCNYCPRRFGTRNSKVCHERLHTGERPFKCNTCLKGFAQLEGLKSHMKNHNKMLRKHICKFCSLRFITRKNLLDHEQRHLGSKPHICIVCSRGFFKQEDLEVHSKLHIGENNKQNKSNEDDLKICAKEKETIGEQLKEELEPILNDMTDDNNERESSSSAACPDVCD